VERFHRTLAADEGDIDSAAVAENTEHESGTVEHGRDAEEPLGAGAVDV
jgi:hypothetical protein